MVPPNVEDTSAAFNLTVMQKVVAELPYAKIEEEVKRAKRCSN